MGFVEVPWLTPDKIQEWYGSLTEETKQIVDRAAKVTEEIKWARKRMEEKRVRYDAIKVVW